MDRLDQNLLELKDVEDQIGLLTHKKDNLRKEIFGIIEDEGLTEGYKNDIATVSYVERKTLVFTDKEKLLKDLVKDHPDYIQVIPQQVIPEHLEWTKEFEEDAKDEKFQHENVLVRLSNNLSLRFKKE